MTRELVRHTRKGADFDSDDDAEATVRATLEALGASLRPGEARDLASFLRATFAEDVTDSDLKPLAQPLEYDEFLDHVAEETGVDAEETELRVRAVMAAVSRIAGEPELGDVLAELPPEYDRAFQTGGALLAESFPEAVADATDLPEDEAEIAARVTLRTLGERLSAGEVEDVVHFLPEPAGEWMVDVSVDESGAFGREEFLARVAERADVDEERAAAYADAVSDVVAGMVPNRELDRMADQLPDDFAGVLDPIVGR
ncbi:hypothetical protein JCM17823_05380 [Halorubrum gandharaense]